MIEEWKLWTTNLRRISQRKYKVAVLPIGSTEAHNLHLPEGTDRLLASHVAEESCRIAFEKTQSVICLPALPYGVDANLMDFPLTIHVSQSVLDAMVRDIVVSLKAHGIVKVVLVNGHGGNDFIPFIRQINMELNVHLFLCDWWTVGNDKYKEIFDKPDNHAGEMETSSTMALRPDLVELQHAGNGAVRLCRFEAVRQGWVKTIRRFSLLNDHCAVGDPAAATPEKGRRYLDIAIQRLADLLTELAVTPIDDKFPSGRKGKR